MGLDNRQQNAHVPFLVISIRMSSCRYIQDKRAWVVVYINPRAVEGLNYRYIQQFLRLFYFYNHPFRELMDTQIRIAYVLV